MVCLAIVGAGWLPHAAVQVKNTFIDVKLVEEGPRVVPLRRSITAPEQHKANDNPVVGELEKDAAKTPACGWILSKLEQRSHFDESISFFPTMEEEGSAASTATEDEEAALPQTPRDLVPQTPEASPRAPSAAPMFRKQATTSNTGWSAAAIHSTATTEHCFFSQMMNVDGLNDAFGEETSAAEEFDADYYNNSLPDQTILMQQMMMQQMMQQDPVAAAFEGFFFKGPFGQQQQQQQLASQQQQQQQQQQSLEMMCRDDGLMPTTTDVCGGGGADYVASSIQQQQQQQSLEMMLCRDDGLMPTTTAVCGEAAEYAASCIPDSGGTTDACGVQRNWLPTPQQQQQQPMKMMMCRDDGLVPTTTTTDACGGGGAEYAASSIQPNLLPTPQQWGLCAAGDGSPTAPTNLIRLGQQYGGKEMVSSGPLSLDGKGRSLTWRLDRHEVHRMQTSNEQQKISPAFQIGPWNFRLQLVAGPAMRGARVNGRSFRAAKCQALLRLLIEADPAGPFLVTFRLAVGKETRDYRVHDFRTKKICMADALTWGLPELMEGDGSLVIRADVVHATGCLGRSG